jgi:hypothetical protein
MEGFEGGPIIQIIGLDGGSRDDSDQKLIGGLARNGVDGKIETVEVLFIIVF